jgi:hypothetical protein
MRRITIPAEETEPVVDLSTAEQVTADLGTVVTDAEVTRASKEIAEVCERVFALETVTETFRLDWWERPLTLPLSRVPVVEIASVTENGVELDPEDYEVETESGTLGKTDRYAVWCGPVVVVYEGGYNLPDESPALLQRAVSEWIKYRNDQAAASVSGGVVRDIAHGDTRISFATQSQSSSGAIAPDPVMALLGPFMNPISL